MPRSNNPADLISGFGYSGSSGGGFGGGQNAYNPAYGGIPSVPNPTSTASSAIGGNLGNLGNIYNIATGTGAASGAGVINALNQEIPGVSGSIGAATGNINQLLSGQVPGDVIAQLKQNAAEIGAGSGMGAMSPMSNASYLRSLGLTSLGMKQQGQQALDALMGSVPRAPAFDPSSMLVTPGQEQEWAFLASELRNAPVPAAAAKANLDALRAGTGYGSAPVGGFNVPVHGGPAFGPDTGLTGGPEDTGYPVMPWYGGTGAAGAPTDPYADWGKLAQSWANPAQSQEDIYNLGLSPAMEQPDYMGTEEFYGDY